MDKAFLANASNAENSERAEHPPIAVVKGNPFFVFLVVHLTTAGGK